MSAEPRASSVRLARGAVRRHGVADRAQTTLLTDQHGLAIAELLSGGDGRAAVSSCSLVACLPTSVARRGGTGPALAIVRRWKFGEHELAYLRSLGFSGVFLEYLARSASR